MHNGQLIVMNVVTIIYCCQARPEDFACLSNKLLQRPIKSKQNPVAIIKG